METAFLIILFGLGLVVLPVFLTIMGAVGGYVSAKVAQGVEPNITNSDVALITRGWAKGFGLGGVIAALFFGISLAALFGWDYILTGILMTIGFTIVGNFASKFGAKPMIERLAILISTSESGRQF
jgi:hypothetical protein